LLPQLVGSSDPSGVGGRGIGDAARIGPLRQYLHCASQSICDGRHRPCGYRPDAGDSLRRTCGRPDLSRLRRPGRAARRSCHLKNRHEAARTPAGRRSVNVVLILLSRRASRGRVFLGRPVGNDFVLRVCVGVGYSRCSLDSSCRPPVEPRHMTGKRRFPPP
jgi:hypothetical protein